MNDSTTEIEPLLRELAPRVLGLMLRRHHDFHACEDAVQEALLAATVQWPSDGVPDHPVGWLVTVASRRIIELSRREAARRGREEVAAASETEEPEQTPDTDDTLKLLFLCCHPSLTPRSQVALTLRAVGGLTTGQIARAHLVPEPTMGQRISRAKRRIRQSGGEFTMPSEDEFDQRLTAVLHVLYLIFNEGYAASSGTSLLRPELTGEAIRLTRQLHQLLPDNGEATGLLALMLLAHARRDARTGPDGALIPLADQDRKRWDPDAIAEGAALITGALAKAKPGPYQLQAAISAVHDEAASYEDTDWKQIIVLYEMLARVAPSRMVTLNRIVAVAMVEGPEIGLRELDRAAADPALSEHYRVDAVRGHLLELAGDLPAAARHYRSAARGTLSLPEQRYLEQKAARLDS